MAEQKNNKKGIKRFSDFQKDSKKNNPKEFSDVEEKGKAPRNYIGASQPYDDDMNKAILAQEVVLKKGKADRQTNLNLTKDIQSIEDDSIKPKNNPTNSKKEKDEEKEKKSIKENKDVKLVGKVAQFPKNVKASNAYNYLNNVKIAKKDIYYILVEKQSNELQMIKYNQKEGVNLAEFVNELKKYYISKYKGRKDLVQIFEKIDVTGEDRFSVIKNIPNFEIDGKKVITKITEDLINLLSK